MYFKKIITVVLLMSASACSWVHDEPKPSQNFQSKNLDLSCLKIMPTQLQNLFTGAYTDSAADKEQNQEIWECLDHALDVFSRNTRGQNPDYYDSAELQKFANRYLPADQVLTDSFTTAIFKLKRDVIGGNETQINRAEIGILQDKLKLFGKTIAPLAPYIGTLLTPTGSGNLAKRDAGLALNNFVVGLSAVLGNSANPILWSDLISFIDNLDQYTNLGKSSSLTLVKEQLPVFQYVKLLIVGGSADSIEGQKWKPIFESISHVYDALFLSSSTSDLFEQLSIEVQSTNKEQQVAVNALIKTLIQMKADSTLKSKRTIDLMADSLAKVLLVNAVLFPSSLGSIALKPFLASDSMRKLAGLIVEELPVLQQKTIAHDDLQKLANQVTTLIDQAGLLDSDTVCDTLPVTLNGVIRNERVNCRNVYTPVSLTQIQTFLTQITPLFDDQADVNLISSGLASLSSAIPVIIGKDAEHLTPDDLRALIQKSLKAYFVWTPATPAELNEKLGASLDILLESPAPSTIVAKQLFSLADQAKSLLERLKVVTTLDWAATKDQVNKGFRVKSLLFQNSDTSISSYELNQIAYLWDPFRRNTDIGVALAATANLLANRPFAEIQMTDLVAVINTVFPANKKVAGLSIDAELLGNAKAILIGGSKTKITTAEYAPLARTAAALYSNLYPVVKDLTSDFQAGLNAKTLDIAKAAVQGLMDAKAFPEIKIADLVSLLNSFSKDKKSGSAINANLISDLKVIVLGGSRTTITSADYAALSKTVNAIHQNLSPAFKDLPSNFQLGLNSKTIAIGKGLVKGLIASKAVQKTGDPTTTYQNISMLDLKTLLLDVLNNDAITVRPSTIDKLLAGLGTRIFLRSKDTKPSDLNLMVLNPGNLKEFDSLFDQLQIDLADVETTFAGLDITTQTKSRTEILSTLKTPNMLSIATNLQPLLDGTDHLHHFKTRGVVHDRFYEYDLAYKATIHNLILWLTPYYKFGNGVPNDPELKNIRLNLKDLTDLLVDINDLIFDLRLSLSKMTPAQSAATRLLDVNLFTQVGNGDDYMDPLEAVEFLTITNGSGILLNQIEADLFATCFPGVAPNTITQIPITCITNNYFTEKMMRKTYAQVAPLLAEQYYKWGKDDRETYRKGALTSTRAGWTETGMMEIGDFETLASLPYFLENIFERFDSNEDDTLQFSEIMKGFPVFCQEIQLAGKGSLKGSCKPGEFPNQIEAVYGYLLYYGHAPVGHGLGFDIMMLKWFSFWRNLDRTPAVRDKNPPLLGRQDLLTIISSLSTATTP